MAFDTLIEQYRQALQVAYRQAMDADALLEGLQQDNKGHFNAIFRDDAGFSTESNRFMPYIQELADALGRFETAPDPASLPPLVKQLELVLLTLGQFRQQLRS